MTKQYRLIWFQHFHKAAGSSILNIAKENGESFYKNHTNGNPVDPDGKEIKLWDYSASQTRLFIDECEKQAVTFIATEWGLPDLDTLKSDHRVVLISCLRDPIARFKSNFYYDLYNGFTSARNLKNYIATRNRTITMHNYYCRILSRQNNNPETIEEKHFNIAKNALDQFDFVVNLEDGLISLTNFLDWNFYSDLKANQSNLSLKQLISFIKNRKFKLIYFYIRYPKRTVKTAFINFYKEKNKWDYELFKTIKRHKVNKSN